MFILVIVRHPSYDLEGFLLSSAIFEHYKFETKQELFDKLPELAELYAKDHWVSNVCQFFAIDTSQDILLTDEVMKQYNKIYAEVRTEMSRVERKRQEELARIRGRAKREHV